MHEFVGPGLTQSLSYRPASYEDTQYPVNYMAVLVNPGKNSMTVRSLDGINLSFIWVGLPAPVHSGERLLTTASARTGVRHSGGLPPFPAAAPRCPVVGGLYSL